MFSTPVGTESFSTNWVNVAMQTADVGSLLLNGSSVSTTWSAIGTTGYSVANVAVGVGASTLSGANPFLATLSGFDNYDTYLTIIGSTFSPGASNVPAPVPLALLGLGLLGLGVAKRR